MEPQLNVPIRRLAEETRSLFDATTPIPQEVDFQPRQAEMRPFMSNFLFAGLFAGGHFGGSGLCFIIVLTGSLLDGSYKIRDIGDLMACVVLFHTVLGIRAI